MKKKILIISGGISKERLISLDTGKQVANELKKNGYSVKITEPDNNLAKNIKFFKPNVIFNALHGQFGEDGYIQTILERFKIELNSALLSSHSLVASLYSLCVNFNVSIIYDLIVFNRVMNSILINFCLK